MKYVMIGYSIPIIFTDASLHSDFAGSGNITSAGSFTTHVVKGEIKVSAYGGSASLGLKVDPMDAAILERFLNGDN
jgi:hypothetical protein